MTSSKWLMMLVAGLLLSSTAFAQPQKYAIIVGINKYPRMAPKSQLEACISDATRMRSALQNGLIPNSIDKDNFISAGTVTFPRGAYEIPIQEPVGKDVVVALLSKEKLNLGEKLDYTWSEIFTRLNFKRFSEFVKSRDLNLETPPAAITNWQASAIVVESVK